jgi:thiol:disulfide interchange protein DsbD
MKVLKFIFLLMLFFSCYTLTAKQEKIKSIIDFRNEKMEALIDSAKLKKKIILVQCAAEWCLPCKQMEKYTFTDSVLIKYSSKNLICKRLDASGFDDIDWLTKYKVEKFPTTLFLAYDGKEINRLTGFQSSKNIIEMAEKIYHPKKIFIAKKFILAPKK